MYPLCSSTLDHTPHLCHKHNRILGKAMMQSLRSLRYKSQRSCKLTHHLLTARRQAFIHHTASITPLWPPSVTSVAKNGHLISWTATIGQYICNKRPLDFGSALIRRDSTASESPYFCFIYFTRPSSVDKVDWTTRQTLFFFFLASFIKASCQYRTNSEFKGESL